MKKTEKGGVEMTETKTVPGPFLKFQVQEDGTKRISIARQSCLKAAVELVVPFVVGGKVADSNTAADVALKLAERFEAWVKRS